LIVMAIHALTFGQILPLDADPSHWGWMGLSGIVGFVLGDAMLFAAFVMIGARLSMLMMALAPVLAAALSWVFLGETLDTRKLMGMALTIDGVMWVVSDKGDGKGVKGRAYWIGILLGLGGAAGQAGGMILSKLGLANDFPAFSGNAIRLFAAAITIWLITAAQKKAVPSYHKLRQHPKALWPLLGGVLLGPILGVWLSLIAVQNTEVGIATTLSSLTPIFLLPIGYVAFRERITRRAVGGTLIAFAGTALLFL
jgi:drug/metabolite transporter (DMT)-like permease